MPDVIFSEDDLNSVIELPSAWYTLLVKDIAEGPGKADPTSTVWKVTMEVNSGRFKGAPVVNIFSEKFMGPFVKYMQTFGKVEKGVKIPYDKTIGKEVQGFVINGQFGNQVKDWKPVGK